VSVRKACEALRIDRSLYTYKSRRGDQAGLKQWIKDICRTRVRYGYRRVHVLLVRDGWPINIKRTRRLYNELHLQLRNKTPKRRVKAKLREDRSEATRCNQTWAMDFVHDQLATGKKLRVLSRQRFALRGHRRHLVPLLPNGRSALQLSRRGRRCHSRASVPRSRLSATN